jgi:hypothetical protein
MKKETVSPSLHNFSLTRTHVQQFTSDLRLSSAGLGFMFFALGRILRLQDTFDGSIRSVAVEKYPIVADFLRK